MIGHILGTLNVVDHPPDDTLLLEVIQSLEGPLHQSIHSKDWESTKHVLNTVLLLQCSLAVSNVQQQILYDYYAGTLCYIIELKHSHFFHITVWFYIQLLDRGHKTITTTNLLESPLTVSTLSALFCISMEEYRTTSSSGVTQCDSVCLVTKLLKRLIWQAYRECTHLGCAVARYHAGKTITTITTTNSTALTQPRCYMHKLRHLLFETGITTWFAVFKEKQSLLNASHCRAIPKIELIETVFFSDDSFLLG